MTRIIKEQTNINKSKLIKINKQTNKKKKKKQTVAEGSSSILKVSWLIVLMVISILQVYKLMLFTKSTRNTGQITLKLVKKLLQQTRTRLPKNQN